MSMRFIHVVVLTGCWLLQLPFSSSLANENVIGYTKRTYLVSDDERDHRPVNRFEALGKDVRVVGLSKHQSDEIRRGILARIRQNLRCVRCSITNVDALDTPQGKFVIYRLIGHMKNTVSMSKSADLKPQPENASHVGIAVLREKKILLAPVAMTIRDQEVGEEEKQLWDIFELNGVRYALVYVRHFESYNFEIYQFESDKLSRNVVFEFGGL